MLIVSVRAVEEEEKEMRDLTHQLSALQANDTTHTHGGGYPHDLLTEQACWMRTTVLVVAMCCMYSNPS